MTTRKRFSQYWVVRVREPALFFAGKRGSRRHSTTGFREIEIVVEADTSYQMFVVLSFWDGDKALLQSIN